MRRQTYALGLVAALALASASCGDVIRQGRSPVLLVVNSLTAAPGKTPTQFSQFLDSDVLNIVTSPDPCSPTNPCPTIFSDVGQATFALAMKDTSITPTSNNQVTLTSYHVQFTRADGRNSPGVDVPYAFDGAVTLTLAPGGTASVGFEIVRHVAKLEAPLVQLINNSNLITTLATVTFYGHDLVGNDITATGTITVVFGNFGG